MVAPSVVKQDKYLLKYKVTGVVEKEATCVYHVLTPTPRSALTVQPTQYPCTLKTALSSTSQGIC